MLVKAAGVANDVEGLIALAAQTRPVLNRLNPRRTDRRTSLSIEVGHVSFNDPRCTWSDILRISGPSLRLSANLRTELVLRDPSGGSRPPWSTITLIDDKAVPRSRRSLIGRYSRLLRRRGVDFVAMESELSEDAARFTDRLQPKTSKGIERFVRENSVLPCSVDIAIWYSIRLGLIDLDASNPRLSAVSPAARSARVAPVADALVSILYRAGGEAAIYERKADRLLEAAWGPEVVRACRRIYYEVDPGPGQDLITRCPAEVRQ